MSPGRRICALDRISLKFGTHIRDIFTAFKIVDYDSDTGEPGGQEDPEAMDGSGCVLD